MKLWAALLLLIPYCAPAAALPGIELQRLFGPETPTGRYKHPASITELANGYLYLAWYGGDGEYLPGSAVYGTRFSQGNWSAPQRIAQDPFYSVGNPVVWQAPDGTVWLWYVIRPGATWSTSRIAVKVSKDAAQTWSDSSIVSFEEGTMVRGKPIVLTNGDYLLPVWKETGFDPEVVGASTASFFLRFDPRARQSCHDAACDASRAENPGASPRQLATVFPGWSQSTRIHSHSGALQPAVAQIDDLFLIAFCRRGGGYGPQSSGFIVRSESHDGGKTWSEGIDTVIPNPNAAVDLLRLKNGHLLLVYNDSAHDRTPLTVAVCRDNGKTFPVKKNIAVGPHDYAYPYMIQTRDGRVHIVFTSDGRSVVNQASFDESVFNR